VNKNFSVKQMKSALIAIKGKISDPQWAMLRAHYVYRTLSMKKIAFYGGYGGNFRAGNSQYGSLCGRIARQLRFSPKYAHDQTYVIATGDEARDEKGHSQWRMDDVVTRALEELDCVKPITDEASEKKEPLFLRRIVRQTQRKALINARKGQGKFRFDVIALWGCCSVTGCSLGKILVASHIVPWAQATNRERLDPFNGMLLTPNFDKLVDLLLVSFNDDGSILLSKNLTAEAVEVLGVKKSSRLRFVRPATLLYLRRHRRLFRDSEKSRN
jgi:hypothetical protein